MEIISKIVSISQEKGWKAVINRSLIKITRAAFAKNRLFLFERYFSQAWIKIRLDIPVEVNLFSGDETIDWLKNNGESWMFNQREMEVGLPEKHYFPNVKYRGKIIGYAKVGRGRVYIEDYEKIFKLPRNAAFIYDSYILPEYRGLKIAQFFINEVMKSLKNNGITILQCYIPPDNIPSLAAYSKLGFKKKQLIRYFKLGGWKYWHCRPTEK